MKLFYIGLSFAVLLSAVSVQAQSFGPIDGQRTLDTNDFGVLLEEKGSTLPEQKYKFNQDKTLLNNDDIESALAEEKERLKQERENIFMPRGGYEKLKLPTLDKSERGSLTIVETDEKGYSRENSNIFLYMDNFEISHTMKNMVTCTMRFIILTNLDRRLTSLDVKLVWPGLTTTLSFSGVRPNQPTAYNYALLGDGCYTMDKTPNIIVNRCRVKGISSADCADKIVWLSNVK